MAVVRRPRPDGTEAWFLNLSIPFDPEHDGDLQTLLVAAAKQDRKKLGEYARGVLVKDLAQRARKRGQ